MEEAAFGRYRLLSVIGRGGMGTVYKAHDTALDRDVAIKILPSDLATEPGYRERFRREARIAARLTEPHIISIHDAGEIDGRLYLTMPVIDGVDVHALLNRDGPMSPQRAVTVIDQLAAALDAAHAAGLVHRDVKPSNALVTATDFAYLIDFGIAHDATATKLTRTGIAMGSWAYMAPEQFDNPSSGAGIDVYALTCVLYECLTGAQPYPGDSFQQQFAGHYTLDPPDPTQLNPTVPSGFGPVIARGMAKDPAQRYQSAGDLATAAKLALDTAAHPYPHSAPTRPDPSQPPPATTVRSRPLPSSSAPVTAVRHQSSIQPPPATPRRSVAQSPATQRRSSALIPLSRGTPLRRTDRGGYQLGPRLVISLAVVLVAGAGVVVYFLRPHPDDGQSSRTLPTTAQVAVPGQGTPTNQTAATTAPSASASGPNSLQFTGLNGPKGVAVDRSGTVYVADTGNNQVMRLTKNASAATILTLPGLSSPTGVAVDDSQALYVANAGNNVILKLPAGASSTTQLPVDGLKEPRAIAIDAADDLFIIDATSRVQKLAAGSSNTTSLNFTGLNNPSGIAVNAAGDLYITDTGNNRILKLANNTTTPTTIDATGLNNPTGIAVNAAGDLYITDTGNNRILKLANNTTTPTTIDATGLNNPTGIAVNAAGDLYITDTGNNRILEVAG